MSDFDLLYGTVKELAEAQLRRTVSSVELTTLYLDRLEIIGPKLGALAHLTRPLALKQAGPSYSESRLLSLAAAYQACTDWHRRRPPEISLKACE